MLLLPMKVKLKMCTSPFMHSVQFSSKINRGKFMLKLELLFLRHKFVGRSLIKRVKTLNIYFELTKPA